MRDLKLRLKDISQDLNLRSMVKWPNSHSDGKLIPIFKKSFDKKNCFFLFPFIPEVLISEIKMLLNGFTAYLQRDSSLSDFILFLLHLFSSLLMLTT